MTCLSYALCPAQFLGIIPGAPHGLGPGSPGSGLGLANRTEHDLIPNKRPGESDEEPEEQNKNKAVGTIFIHFFNERARLTRSCVLLSASG
jgi:hypothetical protein